MAKRKRANEPEQRPASIRWEFGPAIPTEDFFEGGDLTDPWDLQEAINHFIYWLEENRFLTWEAVVCYEQGEPLTARQEKALDALIRFEESDDEQILSIEERARPSEPWHAILNRIVPHLLVEPFQTADVLNEVQLEGWLQLLTALQNYGQGLSL